MLINYKERPLCRMVIEGLLKKRSETLEQLIVGNDEFQMSDDMKEQARKMIQERDVLISNEPTT